MSERYAARIEDGIVVNVIVATAEWAMLKLGGLWVDTAVPVWIGGTWDAENGFQPPVDVESD